MGQKNTRQDKLRKAMKQRRGADKTLILNLKREIALMTRQHKAAVQLDKSAIAGTVTKPPEGLVKLYLSNTSGIEIFTG